MPKSEIKNSDDIIGHFNGLLERAKSGFHRESVVLAGQLDWCIGIVELLGKALDLSQSVVISSSDLPIPLSTTVSIDKAVNLLGHEYSHAIINCHDGIDPNALGAISGTIRGGGLFILLVPEIDRLSSFEDPEKQRMAIWPYQPNDVPNRFLTRFANILCESKTTSVCTKNSFRHYEPYAPSSSSYRDEYLENDRCATVEQRNTVEEILHVIDGHRRRPLVITADRGRGKSSALGIAAADLMKRGGQNIVATGPRFSATEKVFEHAARQVMGAVKNSEIIYKDSSIRYLSVDAIIKENPECSLLIVDEAAAVPVNLLTKLLTLYSRIVFSTTTYGYEGTGRGFNLRFFQILNKTVPGWKHAEIKTPVRWAVNDPLEIFIGTMLCLNAELAKVPADINYSNVVIRPVERDSLVENQAELSQIFSLLVLAHYKTQPRDLRYLMDSLDLEIFVAQYDGIIIGAALVEFEGGLDTQMAENVYRNERRVQGHLLPQSLESTVGIKGASQLRYLRVIRIITHPSCQRHGVGGKILSYIENFARQENIDLLGANFGINNDLLPFWEASGYLPVHVGLSSNTNTGTHSVTVLKPSSVAGEELFEHSKMLFNARVGFLLTAAYKDLDTGFVEYLFSQHKPNKDLQIGKQQLEDVARFSQSSSDYYMAAESLNKFALFCFYNKNARSLLSDTEKSLLVKKVLQQHTWPAVINSLKLDGKSQGIQMLRQTIAKLEKLLQQ